MKSKNDPPIREFSNSYNPISVINFHGALYRVEINGYQLLFDLQGRIRWIVPLRSNLWPGPESAIRRTLCNNWLLYDSSEYYGIFELVGRYYIPVPLYGNISPFLPENQQNEQIREMSYLLDLVDQAADRYGFMGIDQLKRDATSLLKIIKGTVPVLPPDTIHVDYDLLPLLVTRGCLYNCSFCTVKTGTDIEYVDDHDLNVQIDGIRNYAGKDIANFNSVFLGQNDALAAGTVRILEAASKAFSSFRPEASLIRGSNLFMFGSVTSFLAEGTAKLKELDSLPFERIFINLGLESFHQKTLERIGKPVSSQDVEKAFYTGLELCSRTDSLHISFNFLLGQHLPGEHLELLFKRLSHIEGDNGNCSVYISPLQEESWRIGQLRRTVYTLKAASRLPLYLYLIVPL